MDLGFVFSYIDPCVDQIIYCTFSTWNEPAIFCSYHAHALFHILHEYLRLFLCLIGVYRCRFRTRYKRNTKSKPEKDDIRESSTYLPFLAKSEHIC